MKMNGLFGLFATGVALATFPAQAQTTPTGTATSTTIPQGAIAPDSTLAKTSDRNQKRTMRQNRRQTNQNARTSTGTTNATPQDAQYRQSSTSDGTAVNNSNTTNYNSNNVTNAPTGAGSNPNTAGSAKTSSTSTSGQMNTGEANSNAGTVEAIKGAKTAESPAVKAGSTVRNTSIGDFVSSSPNHITLQNALQSSDLFETLRGTGPYTLFAPTNTAFKKLPAAVQGGLLDGSNRDALKQLLAYHVVSGTLSADELTQQIKTGNGKAQLKTLSGGTLTASMEANGKIALADEQGNTVRVDPAGSRQANGMVYSIETILMPKTGAASFR